MVGWVVVLTIWSVVAAGLVLWFGRALAAFEAPYGPPRDATACACCRTTRSRTSTRGPATAVRNARATASAAPAERPPRE